MRIPPEHRDNYHICTNYLATTEARRALEEDGTDQLDWIVITAFYQALHWVDAYLFSNGWKPRDHEERRSCILSFRDLDPYCWRLLGS